MAAALPPPGVPLRSPEEAILTYRALQGPGGSRETRSARAAALSDWSAQSARERFALELMQVRQELEAAGNDDPCQALRGVMDVCCGVLELSMVGERDVAAVLADAAPGSDRQADAEADWEAGS